MDYHWGSLLNTLLLSSVSEVLQFWNYRLLPFTPFQQFIDEVELEVSQFIVLILSLGGSCVGQPANFALFTLPG